jgi:hypothetical protein
MQAKLKVQELLLLQSPPISYQQIQKEQRDDDDEPVAAGNNNDDDDLLQGMFEMMKGVYSLITRNSKNKYIRLKIIRKKSMGF